MKEIGKCPEKIIRENEMLQNLREISFVYLRHVPNFFTRNFYFPISRIPAKDGQVSGVKLVQANDH